MFTSLEIALYVTLQANVSHEKLKEKKRINKQKPISIYHWNAIKNLTSMLIKQ